MSKGFVCAPLRDECPAKCDVGLVNIGIYFQSTSQLLDPLFPFAAATSLQQQSAQAEMSLSHIWLSSDEFAVGYQSAFCIANTFQRSCQIEKRLPV